MAIFSERCDLNKTTAEKRKFQLKRKNVIFYKLTLYEAVAIDLLIHIWDFNIQLIGCYLNVDVFKHETKRHQQYYVFFR